MGRDRDRPPSTPRPEAADSVSVERLGPGEYLGPLTPACPQVGEDEGCEGRTTDKTTLTTINGRRSETREMYKIK